ncbi:uncharacterized protein PITG_02070 [Phytophthora infestans T30-4]|uniref:Uncharacterized protein n=1 Tax=Phytophthora infestans (strain T30-4) TaxID=403677 RepID=D0MVE2_PHYIT|nr:uncharacterized protein PITG_02070 [Phytophthora infestans T30-4]EEY63605.1 conserved hypothetical protein [Phytophthora infestans T30-4]|eukprot:XP_002907041.1 conserved hypothetical protein [Phytophthora infestans T30-4]
MVSPDNVSLTTTIMQSDVELDGDEPQVLQVVAAPPVRSGGGDDETLCSSDCVNASKPERWVEITERLGSALSKELSAGGTTPMYTAGQEPHKSVDENELERLVEVYVQKKNDETLVQSKRTESKTKKVAMTGPSDA